MQGREVKNKNRALRRGAYDAPSALADALNSVRPEIRVNKESSRRASRRPACRVRLCGLSWSFRTGRMGSCSLNVECWTLRYTTSMWEGDAVAGCRVSGADALETATRIDCRAAYDAPSALVDALNSVRPEIRCRGSCALQHPAGIESLL